MIRNTEVDRPDCGSEEFLLRATIAHHTNIVPTLDFADDGDTAVVRGSETSRGGHEEVQYAELECRSCGRIWDGTDLDASGATDGRLG